MALGLLMPLTPLTGGTRLEGYITVGSLDFGGGIFAYGYYPDGDPEFPALGSVSGTLSADVEAILWYYGFPGAGGSVGFATTAFVGGYFHFSGESVLLNEEGTSAVGEFSVEQAAGFPTSGTHPFYVELP